MTKLLLLVSLLFCVSACRTLTFDDASLAADRFDEPRYVILTADDFGAAENINRGIRKGLDTGLISSVTAMVTFPGALDEIRLLKQDYPAIPVGLHLSITSGYPVSDRAAIPSLVGQDGRFYSIDEIVSKVGRIDRGDLELELRAQIETFIGIGLDIDNLSSQHNVLGMYTPFFDILLRLAVEYGLPMRSTVLVSNSVHAFSYAKTRRRGRDILRGKVFYKLRAVRQIKKYMTVREMSENQRRMDERAIAHPDYLIDAFWGDPTPQNMYRILTHLPPGVSEIVLHLGVHEGSYEVPAGIDGEYFLMREFELFCIRSPEMNRWLELLNVERIGYGDLSLPTE